MKKITKADKIGLNNNSSIADENKFTADDFNKIKEAINLNADETLSRLEGYGGLCKEVSGDWNTACGRKSGFYMGAGLANRPNDDTVSQWFFVLHFVQTTTYMSQLALSFGTGCHMYIRAKSGGTWTSWKQIT